MEKKLSLRAQSIKPSITLTISAKAKAMKEGGIDVLNFSAGEPDFDTPDTIKQAANSAIEAGFTKYTAAGGIPELKEAIIAKYQVEQNLSYRPSQVLVSNGGKHALHNIFQAVLEPGDEVVIPSPYWLSYPDMVILSGGTPVILNTHIEDHFKITPESLAAVITPRTKLLILNSPSNPTGAVYSAGELSDLAKVIGESGIMVISDDVYEKFVFDEQAFFNLLMVAPQLKESVIIINSASKTYSMTGWRIGYAIGPEAIIQAATRIQGQATSCAGAISQKALTFALQTDTAVIEVFRQSFEKRRNLMYDGLAAIDGIQVYKPAGAFYLFCDVSRFYDKLPGVTGSVSFCDYLLSKYRIASIPGKAFGEDRCIRFSFVTDEASICNGISRLAEMSSTI
jgi:aspartate aminotransferase